MGNFSSGKSPSEDQKKGVGFVLVNESKNNYQSYSYKASKKKISGDFFSFSFKFFLIAIIFVIGKSLATNLKDFNHTIKERSYSYNQASKTAWENKINSLDFKKKFVSVKNERIKKITENEILLAEIKKNREELTKIQNQLNSQKRVMNNQNDQLKKVQQFNHWQGISRMMNSFGLN